ncbi:hypothetical protein OH492_00115 [Vibrio chagasii]|nr:hypothetical protein [Vibrio chagasii]
MGVLVIVKNAEQHLEDLALSSVFKLDWINRDFRFLAVLDGTLDIAKKYADSVSARLARFWSSATKKRKA